MAQLNQLLKNYFIHDCCIVNDDYIFVIAEEYLTEDEYAQDKLGEIIMCVRVLTEEPEDWGYLHWEKNSFYKPKLVNIKPNEALVISNGGRVYYYGTGDDKQFEQNIPHEVSAGCYSAQKIDGEVYVTGVCRNVAVRRGVDNWENIAQSIFSRSGSAGFLAVDGFNKNDLYAVGGDNDVFRYDGEDWIPLDVTDRFLPKVVCCCAEDGYVYIAGAWGMVVRGREDNWETKSVPKSSGLLFTSIVSYQGKILLGTEASGTFVIDHNVEDFTPRPYDFEGEIRPLSARHIDAGYGMLMMASDHAIALHDGKKWLGLYNSPEKQEEEDLQAMSALADKLEEVSEGLSDTFDEIKKIVKN